MRDKTNGQLPLRWMAAFLAAFMTFPVHAANVQAVSGSMQGGGEVLRIELSEPLQAPITGFAIQSPARIALDLPGARSALRNPVVPIQLGNLQTANVVEAEGKTRLVLNLASATSYRTQISGNTVLVFLEPVAPVTTSAAAASPALSHAWSSAEPQTHGNALKNIDFRRSSAGAGRLVVDLGNPMVSADVRAQGQSVIIDLLQSHLPESLRRRLDVVDFATPVQTITATQLQDRVRIQVDAKGEWQHSAYQSDGQFVLEVRPQKIDNNKLTQGPDFSGEHLSLNFQNIEVRALLQVIADFTNFNIVTSDTVTGTLTLRLKDVPWDQALNIIMEAKGLGMKRTGNVLWIAPKEEIDERTKRDLEAARKIEELEPLKTQGFQINYAKAEDLKRQFADNSNSSESSTRFLSPRGSAIAEPRTNQLFVTDTSSKLEEIAELLKKLDVPVRQVLIEARIVEARDTFGRSLGVKFGGGYQSGRGSVGSNYVAPSAGAVNSVGNPFVNLPASLSTDSQPNSLALSIFNSGLTRFLSLELSAMEAEGMGSIISNPKLLTADQSEAEIKQGTQIPYKSSSGAGVNAMPRVEFKDATLSLKVVPQITPEGNILMQLEVNKDAVGVMTPDGPSIDTKSIKTQVLVENGGTVVIGGIYEMEETNQTSKVPVLGDIPVMGNLFKSRSRESTKREMLVFITPRMVTDAIAMPMH